MNRMAHTTVFKPFIPAGTREEHEGALTRFPLTPASFLPTLTTCLESDELVLHTIVASDRRGDLGVFRISYFFGHLPSKRVLVPYFDTTRSFPSLSHVRMQCSFYEREMATMFGLVPEGHRDPRPTMGRVSFGADTYPLRKDAKLHAPSGKADPLTEYDFHTVAGEGVYEIPVGPVHAGIIEPGHFRFSVLGERIKKLDPLLGWKHKGIEKLFETLPMEGKIALAERISGDSSFAHSLAFCGALEKIAHAEVSEYGRLVRVVCAELERMANHFSDIGFIMLDTAFTFGGANGARLRERVMRWNERLTGSRFLRGVNTPGGVRTTVARDEWQALVKDLADIRKDFKEVIAVAEERISLYDRLITTGDLAPEAVREYGVVGVPARAAGICRDTRIDFPYAAYDMLTYVPVVKEGGDVYARFQVRVDEVYGSIALIEQAVERLSRVKAVVRDSTLTYGKDATAVMAVEGWRGEVVHVVCTDASGVISRVKVRDPSFLNWQAFPLTVVDEVVPDFPLVNKSFNLSYSGNDL